MFGIGVPELVLILIIGLVVFGPGKLPEIGKAVGRSLNEFKKATNGIGEEREPTKIVRAETPPTGPVQEVTPKNDTEKPEIK